MEILIDDAYTCLDAVATAQNLARIGFPAPHDFGLANSMTVPVGPHPGRGLFLMMREDLDQIDADALHDVTFDDGINPSLTFHDLVYVVGRCLTPSAPEDPKAVFLVEFADARWRVHNPTFSIPINKQYNVRAPGFKPSSSRDYYDDSRNAGTDWTWQTMVTDIWSLMAPLGTAPTLPITPDGAPEGWIFPGTSAWLALNQVLCRIGCAAKIDLTPSTPAWTIIQVGATDTDMDAAQEKLIAKGLKIFDEEFQEGVRGRVPYGVRVFFHRQEEHYGNEQTTPKTSTQWSTSAVYKVDIVGPNATAAEAGTYHPIWDDLPALYDASGSLSNGSALNTRAQARSDDFFRMLRGNGGSRQHRIYSGLHPLFPGPSIKAVVWRQDLAGIRANKPGGIVTEIVRHPFRFIKGMSPQGQWVEDDAGSLSIQPPAFGPAYPNYPVHFQKIRITTATPDGSGRFTAFVQQYNPVTRAWADKEACYAVEQNSVTPLTTNKRYDGRLSGYDTTLPVYTIDSGVVEYSAIEVVTDVCAIMGDVDVDGGTWP